MNNKQFLQRPNKKTGAVWHFIGEIVDNNALLCYNCNTIILVIVYIFV